MVHPTMGYDVTNLVAKLEIKVEVCKIPQYLTKHARNICDMFIVHICYNGSHEKIPSKSPITAGGTA